MEINLRNLYKYNLNNKIIKFHMPGNYGGKNLANSFKENLAYFDTTEVMGMDDYHSPEGIIKTSEAETAKMFKSDYSIYLVNGSTSGIIAALTYLFKEGDRVLIAKDSHKSVSSGLVISGAQPIYCTKNYYHRLGMYLPLSYRDIEESTAKDPSIKGVMLTSPNYFGIGTKELSKIVELCKKRKFKLILDEAHGSHLYFSDLEKYMGNICRVPVVINSTHKNMTGLTQTGVLNINSDSINQLGIRKHLSLITSTSPSYILLSSISQCTHQYINDGVNFLQNTIKKAIYMKELLNKYKIRYIKDSDLAGEHYLDPTKITILFSDNESADLVYTKLIEDGIVPELVINNKIIFFINTQITNEDIKKAVAILARLYKRDESQQHKTINAHLNFNLQQSMSPREAYFSDKEQIHYKDSVGRIATETITPYPPGIPVVLPGQVINSEVIQFLSNNSSSVHGTINGMIEVVK